MSVRVVLVSALALAVVLTPRMQAALGLAAVGLALLAGLAGFWLGRRGTVARGTTEA